MAPASCRQNYDSSVSDAINNQINNELSASYAYLAMANHFGRVEVAMPGAQSFFLKQSYEEREHAQKLVEYQMKRGGRVVLYDIAKPQEDTWKTLQDAFKTALELEKGNNRALLDLHCLAGQKNDPDCTKFLEDFYLGEQVTEIEQMARRYNQLRRVGPGLGEHLYDQELLRESAAKEPKSE
uniref:Ferritin n=1 Tax=Steinernema glaseri TaxID=37863 RepID=A0A1I7ZNG1_9BILA